MDKQTKNPHTSISFKQELHFYLSKNKYSITGVSNVIPLKTSSVKSQSPICISPFNPSAFKAQGLAQGNTSIP